MDNKGALKPDFNIKGFIHQDKKDDELTVEEKILAAGADQIFWKTLKKHFNNSLEILEQINENAISQGMPLEEVGRNVVVISQVKGVLNRIINVVEDAKEALEQRGEAK